MSESQKHRLLDAIFAAQHLVEDAHSSMPPEALGHELRGIVAELQEILDFAVDRIAQHESLKGDR